MKAVVRYNGTRNITGDITFNKTLNLYKVRTSKGNLYLTTNSLNFAKELTPSRKRKK